MKKLTLWFIIMLLAASSTTMHARRRKVNIHHYAVGTSIALFLARQAGVHFIEHKIERIKIQLKQAGENERASLMAKLNKLIRLLKIYHAATTYSALAIDAGMLASTLYSSQSYGTRAKLKRRLSAPFARTAQLVK